VLPFLVLLRAEGHDLSPRCASFHKWETRKAREDTVPHERGLKPVPPFEFFPCSRRFPKLASVACPPVTRRPVSRNPAVLVKPLASRHLTVAHRPLSSLAWG
jgi:hypothetical protein